MTHHKVTYLYTVKQIVKWPTSRELTKVQNNNTYFDVAYKSKHTCIKRREILLTHTDVNHLTYHQYKNEIILLHFDERSHRYLQCKDDL